MKSLARTCARGLRAAGVAGALALTAAACDSLLEVDLPGSVTADALNDPQLAETLVLSAQADFECGFVDYMRFPGQWFEEFQNSSQSRPDALSGLRSQLVAVYADPCDSGTGPLWTTIQLPRQQARRAYDLITAFDAVLVPDKDFLLAKARLYEGYSIQLLGEQFCGVTIDAGPLLTRAQAYVEAETRFTEAISLANTAIAADVRTAEADSVLYAAYVGRARSRMYQGRPAADVIADASLVPVGFEYLATYDGTPGRRRNRIHEENNTDDGMMPHRDYTDLTLDPTTGRHMVASGISDPRVEVFVDPDQPDPRGFTQYRTQLKYIGNDADIPFATWREAQLMIAEVDPSQSVAIINLLRSDPSGLPEGVDETAWPLPAFDATGLTAAEIQTAVWEERRRELWMQGTQAGDKIRWSYPDWDSIDEYGQQVGAGGCMPVPYLEETSNPNL